MAVPDSRAVLDRLDTDALGAAVAAYRDALRTHQQRLNRLNVYPVPDGDTGTNMALTLESVVAEAEGAADLASLCRAVSHGSLMGARGNSGVILSQILRGLTDCLREAEAVDGPALARGLEAAATAAYGAVMRPVEGTILTVAREASESASRAVAADQSSLVAVLEAAASAARDALARTPELLPVLAEAGVVDAGGAGLVLLFDALLHVADGRPLPEADDVAGEAPAAAVSAGSAAPAVAAGLGHGEGGDADLRYEVMFLLEADDAAIGGFKDAWAALGDSIVVVGGDGLWNCHVHTDDAGAAIEAGIEAGRPRRIQITDLRDQVREEQWVREHMAAPRPAAGGGSPPPAACDVVAVAAGEGVAKIFGSLGVVRVVEGGPSMNPSTAELLAAVGAGTGQGAVILPNNRNVQAVAEQAAALAPKPVRVVATASVAEGLAALMGYDPDGDPEANAAAMAEAAEGVRWGEVTWAVRDAPTPAGPASEGDHLGLLGEEIVAVGPDRVDVACRLLDVLVDGGHELVTVLVGAGVAESDTRAVAAWLAEHRPGVAVEVHPGGQPLSAYLFSAE